ncbi:MAG: hypothetical protein GF384_02550, partial [Elusimicrobia bacterium]|nr:hypothetical protein [Elusimicrobiota bacterium]
FTINGIGWTVFFWLFVTCYYVLLEGPVGKGQTLGKKAFSLRAVSREGKLLDVKGAFMRLFFYNLLPQFFSYLTANLAYTMPYSSAKIILQLSVVIYGSYWLINVAFLFIDPMKRMVHDYLSNTIVVYQTGGFDEEQTGKYLAENHVPFVLNRKWGVSVVLILLTIVFTHYYNILVESSEMTRLKVYQNYFISNFKIIPAHIEKKPGESLMIGAMEVAENLDEDARYNELLRMMNTLFEKEIIEKKDLEYQILLMPKVSFFSLFKAMDNPRNATAGEARYFVVDVDNNRIDEKIYNE